MHDKQSGAGLSATISSWRKKDARLFHILTVMPLAAGLAVVLPAYFTEIPGFFVWGQRAAT
jgi:hypothetical protein